MKKYMLLVLSGLAICLSACGTGAKVDSQKNSEDVQATIMDNAGLNDEDLKINPDEENTYERYAGIIEEVVDEHTIILNLAEWPEYNEDVVIQGAVSEEQSTKEAGAKNDLQLIGVQKKINLSGNTMIGDETGNAITSSDLKVGDCVAVGYDISNNVALTVNIWK